MGITKLRRSRPATVRHGTARSFSFGLPGLRFHRQISCLPKEPPADLRDTRRTAPPVSPDQSPRVSPRLWKWQLTDTPMSQMSGVWHFFRAHGVQVASLKSDAALDFSLGDDGEPFPFLFVWGDQQTLYGGSKFRASLPQTHINKPPTSVRNPV